MDRPPRARRLLLGLVTAAALLVTACSNSSSDPDDDAADDTTTSSSGEETSTSAGGDEPSADATSGDAEPAPQTLALGLVGIETLDPLGTSPASASQVLLADLLHDPLTELDENGVAQPALATFAANAERTVWRFELGDDAVFHDGTAIGADDVVFSLERVRGLGNASLAAVQLEGVQSIAAVGDTVVDITLSEPSAILPELLSSPLYGIVDRERTLEAQQQGALVPRASGDHAVTVESGRRLVLERRRGGGPATITVELFDDAVAAHAAFGAGTVDWAPVPVDRLGEATDAVGLSGLEPFHATLMLGVNPQVEPLTNRDLRRAIALAIDRTPLVEAVFGPAAQPMLGLVPQGVPGAPTSCTGPCGPDLEQARQLVASAFPDGQGQPLQLLVDDTEPQQTIAGVLEGQLAEIGLEVDTTSVDPATAQRLISAGRQQLFLFGTLGVSRTPAAHLAPLFRAGSPDNVTGYDNEFVAFAIVAALNEPIASVRATRWQEIQTAVLEDAPVVPLVQLRTIAAVSPRVEGLEIRADGSIDLSDVTVEPAEQG